MPVYAEGLVTNKLEELPKPEIMETPWAEDMRNELQSTMDLFGTTPDIPLLQVAGMTENEQLGQNILTQLGQDAFSMPEVYDAAVTQLMKTFSGDYDPRTSDFYQGFRSEMDQMMSKDIEASRREAQLGGGLYSDYAAGASNNLRRNYANQKLTTLGGMFENERMNMLNAVPTALNASMMPTQKASGIASLIGQFGGLGRKIQDNRNLAKYNQQYGEAMMPYELAGQKANIANSLLNYQPWYQPQFYEKPSVLSQVMNTVAPIIPFFGGGGGQSGGGVVGSGWMPNSIGGYNNIGMPVTNLNLSYGKSYGNNSNTQDPYKLVYGN